ncbi:type II toxin-antitoxin system HipA family toxin [Roseisolibacter agri]|uniref:Uncharacterized protein n=1 Tax=Roseisolibacter agri TaxID=2014610 RepID=A0AA37VGB3_9BACT|nr:type II toxin-antitoxin system HipA family toxin [Roseisolibacter agri]GLC28244.1 hypothetical protein rosag_47570 [Roseisolibacter agri]
MPRRSLRPPGRTPGGGAAAAGARSRDLTLHVFLADRPGSLLVGQLAQRGHEIAFRYDPTFVATGLDLSPLGLPRRLDWLQERSRVFDGLHGVFADSLPDGWGLRLMDREFARLGIEPATVTPVERLRFVGARAMGALVYQPALGPDADPSPLDLDALADQAERLYEGSPEDVLPELLAAGGSPAGARPKVLVAYNADTGAMRSGAEDVPAGYRHYLVKFPTREDGEDIGALEMAYAAMARDAGLDMPPTRLFTTRAGRRCFGVERFDRVPVGAEPAGAGGGPVAHERRHVHTLGGLLHASHREFGCTYGEYLRSTAALTRDRREVLEAFRRMVFNVAASNRDDHVKNFAFLLGPDGAWRLSPAYDLVYAAGPGGEHSMMVGTEGRRPTYRNLLEVAEPAGITAAETGEIVTAVVDAVRRWPERAREFGVTRATAARVGAAVAASSAAALEGRPVVAGGVGVGDTTEAAAADARVPNAGPVDDPSPPSKRARSRAPRRAN